MRTRPSFAAPLLVPVLLLAVLGACGGENEITMPPLTPEPGDSRVASDAGAASPEESLPARLTLYKYLRTIALGSTAACKYTSDEFDLARFGERGCEAGLGRARAGLRPEDVAALRGVTVPTAEREPDGAYTVRHRDLKWRGEPARLQPEPGGPPHAFFLDTYTIRQNGGRWVLDA
ncbi:MULTISPECIES: hypothetical protein [unclassified Spirillospora]|uniref:hypothetical protein n=1 Tax=unclassified Spirillospora TaxID=2642701 RepID=UPI0037115E38